MVKHYHMPTKSYAQAAQDTWVLRSTDFKVGGFFVDLGAYDGLEHSNSVLLEREYGWTGICVEANPGYWLRCLDNRVCPYVIQAAVGDVEGFVTIHGQEVSPYTGSDPCVPQHTLMGILDMCDAPPVIDYLSIDVEGAEYPTLSAFDFNAYRINLMTVEHNMYAHGPAEKERLYDLLVHRGFVRVVDNAVCLDAAYAGSEYEDWYAHFDFLNEMGMLGDGEVWRQ